MSCSVRECQERVTNQEFLDWIEFYKANPPLRDHMNMCQANICYTMAAGNRGKGQKLIPLSKFVLDYKEAVKTDDEKIEDQIKQFFGGLAKKGINNG